jgi:3-oxosteroid 1-dehydrogenase
MTNRLADKPQLEWDLQYDFVSVGGGIGGLSAAVVARHYGMSAAVLEKSSKLGGVGAISGGQLWVAGNHLQPSLGIQDSPESGYRYLIWVSAGMGDASLTKVLTEKSPEVVTWFEKHAGVRWQIIRGHPDYYWDAAPDSLSEGRYLEVQPFPAATLGDWQKRTRVPNDGQPLTTTEVQQRGGPTRSIQGDQTLSEERKSADIRSRGSGLLAYIVKAAIEKNVSLTVDVVVKELITDGPRVVGVSAEIDGKAVAIKAEKGVLIATSGYDWNGDLLRRFDQRDQPASWAMTTVTGDHFKLLGPLGAKIATVPKPTHLSYEDGVDSHGAPVWRGFPGTPHTVVVNEAGNRFADESFYPSLSHGIRYFDGLKQKLVNYPCWGIFDTQHRETYGFGRWTGSDQLPDTFKCAMTLTELAQQCGIDPGGLEAEIARFNDNAIAKVDPIFHRGENRWSQLESDPTAESPCLGTIAKPPYYAVRLFAATIGIATAGIVGDPQGRVMDFRNRPIDGLYIAGNSMAMLEVGAGYQSGVANARAMTFGFLAARHAAQLG